MLKSGKRLKGVGEYYFSKKLKELDELNKAGKNIINLGIGNPDLPPHPDVIRVLQEESQKPDVHGYQSYTGIPLLRNAMSNWYKEWYQVSLDPVSEILPLMGSKEGIMHICMAFLNKGDKVLVPDPGYPTYSSAVKLSGGASVFYTLKEKNRFQPDFKELNAQVKKGNVKMMFVNYPHMPTGSLAEPEVFDKLVRFARKNRILLVHDNPYSFILNDRPASMLQVGDSKEVVIELNSLSKSHNMAGWRVGMLCASKEHVETVLRFKSNMDSGMFLPVQLAAAKALTLGREWHVQVNEVYRKRREYVFKILENLGCTFSKQQAGLFVWAGIPAGMKDGFQLSDELLYKKQVFITPGGVFGNAGKKFVRVSLCKPEAVLGEAMRRMEN